jgi:hypothetical protein
MKYSKGMSLDQFIYVNYGFTTTKEQRHEAIVKFHRLLMEEHRQEQKEKETTKTPTP